MSYYDDWKTTPPEDPHARYWPILEKMRENILESLNDLEMAALNQDIYEFKRILDLEDAYNDAE